MAELKTLLDDPPNKKISAWISTMEFPESAFGNAGPNVRKIKKNKVKK